MPKVEVFAACAIRARVFFSCVRRRLRPQGRAHSERIGLHRSHIRCRRAASTQRSLRMKRITLSCHFGSPDALFVFLRRVFPPSRSFRLAFLSVKEVFAACALRACVFFSCVRRRLRPQGRAHSARIGFLRSHPCCRRAPSTQRSLRNIILRNSRTVTAIFCQCLYLHQYCLARNILA